MLGYAYLDRYNERSAYRRTADLSVYLAQDARGHGIGALLYKAIEEAGRAMGLHSIVSIVTGENTGSVHFHEKMGFCRVGKIAEEGPKIRVPPGYVFLSEAAVRSCAAIYPL